MRIPFEFDANISAFAAGLWIVGAMESPAVSELLPGSIMRYLKHILDLLENVADYGPTVEIAYQSLKSRFQELQTEQMIC